jgi:hypothetical protein
MSTTVSALLLLITALVQAELSLSAIPNNLFVNEVVSHIHSCYMYPPF